MKKIVIFILTFGLLTHNANALWSTGHALVAEIAYEQLDHTTLTKVDQLLNTQPDVPQIGDGKQPSPTPEVLYQTYNYMQGAASWPDDIKRYYWVNFNQKNNFSSMHFIDIRLDLSKQGDSQYCSNTLNNAYINQTINENKENIVTAIESAIKTLALNNTSNSEKATALRYLIHFMGDLAQPLHASDPVLDGLDTYGGNKMYFQANENPYYQQVTGSNPFDDYTPQSIANLHAYFDSELAEFNQLQETIDSSYSPNGFELWSQNKDQYLDYLNYLATRTGTYDDKTELNVISWALGTSKLACKMLISDDDTFHYQLSSNEKSIIVDYNLLLLNQYDKDINQQVYLNGVRLSYLLKAIFQPQSEDPQVINYREKIILPILNNQNILTLNQLSQA
ncbi:S1/P1 nuclease [Thiotrichales bacterium 19S3-7]|nr:S1/P1 nuclease [Thiotrichales bacterium 19S3-7]MCF6801873.1 S1/P1 nuclease [Thiotrichales bacterium 19S3-11]